MAGTCGGPVMGGRRRRTMKSKSKKRGMRGGMGYGFQGAMGTNGPAWGSSWGGEVTKDGTPVLGTSDRVVGGRRRKSAKGKKGKKGRRRTMRGGATWQSPGQVGYGYTGTGSRGLADATGYASRVPPSGGPSQNPDGAYHV
jgi:hypothetical protein